MPAPAAVKLRAIAEIHRQAVPGSSSRRPNAAARSTARKPERRSTSGAGIEMGRRAGGAGMVDGGEAVIGGDEDVGGLVQALCLQSGQQFTQHGVGIARAAKPLGPLMPGSISPTLSLVSCWLMSGSRDQNSSANGLPRSGNAAARCGLWPSSATLPGHMSGTWSCAARLAPRKLASYWRVNQAGRPKPPSWPVLSSDQKVWLPSARRWNPGCGSGPPCRSPRSASPWRARRAMSVSSSR